MTLFAIRSDLFDGAFAWLLIQLITAGLLFVIFTVAMVKASDKD